MKESPQLRQVEERMRAGRITRDGFLGTDRRPLAQILDEDANTVSRLGLTHEQIADRLQHFMDEGAGGLGTTVVVDDIFEVRVESVRGMLPCPWPGHGLFRKTNVYLKNTETGEEMVYTAMQVHTISAHGFYEGRGSPYRIDPVRAKRILGL